MRPRTVPFHLTFSITLILSAGNPVQGYHPAIFVTFQDSFLSTVSWLQSEALVIKLQGLKVCGAKLVACCGGTPATTVITQQARFFPLLPLSPGPGVRTLVVERENVG